MKTGSCVDSANVRLHCLSAAYTSNKKPHLATHI